MNTQEKIAEVKKQIEILEKQISEWEPDIDEYEDQFCEMLDDVEERIIIAGIEFAPSYVLRECDPTAYRCCLCDYVDSLELEPVDLIDELDELNDQLDDLENELLDEGGENV
jgi:predicted  nucleic acid-binding Zn-ribbon protein